MTFLNVFLLGGTLAFAVPLVIHLLHLSRFRVVEWGAMHLLESLVRINRRRFRIEQWLLLAIRCAIPALLAVCMAQPVLTGWRVRAGAVSSSRVVLLDDSYSMQASNGSETNFQRGVSSALAILQRPPAASESAIVLMGDGRPTSDEAVRGVDALRKRLDLCLPDQGPVRIEASLQSGMSQLTHSTLPMREIVVISDFQQRDWLGPQPPQRERLRALLQQNKPIPAVTLWKMPAPPPNNVCVESIEVSQPMVGVRQPVRVRALLRNHGQRGYDDLRVSCRIDGEPVETSQLPLASGAEASALFRCVLDRAGSHVVEVEADADDLPADNRLACVLTALDRIGVLVVNGDPDPQPLRSEAGFLQLALQPFSGAGDKLSDLIQARTVDPTRFDRGSLEDVRVVILANVPKLTELQSAALERFVRTGGGLLVFSGNRLDLDWYNRVFAQGTNALLPMRFASLGGNLTDSARHASIVTRRFQHPALNHFNDRRNGNLADGRVFLWYRLDASTGINGANSSTTELMQLSVGSPLMVECRRGEGSVIQVATACDADWSNLPMRPFYLPLVQQLVLHLASTWDPPRNLEPGQPIVARAEATDSKARLTCPGNDVVDVPTQQSESQRVYRFDGTRRSGVYTLDVQDRTPLHFAVSASRTESRLDTLNDEQLRDLAEAIGGSVVGSFEEYVKSDDLRRHGRPVWQFMLAGVLALMVAELFLARWISRDNP